MLDIMDVFNYDPVSGRVVWALSPANHIKAGDEVSTKDQDGYLYAKYKGKNYRAHRVAHYIMTGVWPNKVDHKDRVKDNNTWDNLRDCSDQQNQYNRGAKGHYWSAKKKAWHTTVKYNGKTRFLGLFKDKQIAEEISEFVREEIFQHLQDLREYNHA